ncbi:hypothetical protein HD597_000751 [Nonomuraea thailandensis]|uniref:Uncharacterized protein n=1 Tax=Nonomuraea thailandensis TaxID=1188745 RepID=A0A9X2GE69_9ACTN|nr:hypothetical protein [Nonomuraea thailandensis]MCP2353731.1 hypothetical protein [Nonomuraea thailandensis]
MNDLDIGLWLDRWGAITFGDLISVVESHGAEKIVIRTTEHEPLQELEFANSALDRPAAVGQGESVADGVVVALEPVGEGVEGG